VQGRDEFGAVRVVLHSGGVGAGIGEHLAEPVDHSDAGMRDGGQFLHVVEIFGADQELGFILQVVAQIIGVSGFGDARDEVLGSEKGNRQQTGDCGKDFQEYPAGHALDFETIAKSAHRDQELRLVGLFFDLFTQTAHVDVDGPRGYEALLAPDFVEKLVAAVGVAGVGEEEIEQAELGGSEVELAVIHEEPVRGPIDAEGPHFRGGYVGIGLFAAQMGFHTGD
jgi:hypothetical protein